MYVMDLVTDRGVPMKVTLRGASVEFYDARYISEDAWLGQFTGGRYDVGTLLQRQMGGLPLQGGEPEWFVDVESMRLVSGWLHLLSRRGELVTEGGFRR